MVLAFVLSLGPVAAFAAGSVDASPVVTVAGSETSVTGTVALSAGTITALADAVRSTVATVTLDATWNDARDSALFIALILTFIASIAVAFVIARG
jgi:ABC-type nitrate/sulfonate/bicarbonate transport system substrate-binding protein